MLIEAGCVARVDEEYVVATADRVALGGVAVVVMLVSGVLLG